MTMILWTMMMLSSPQSPFPPRYAANWQPTYSILQENLIYQVTRQPTHFYPLNHKSGMQLHPVAP